MTKPPSPAPPARTFTLHFLTDEWVWEEQVVADDEAQAAAVARGALQRVVDEEQPALACVTLACGEEKLGVWDWVAAQFVWTPKGSD